MKSKMTREEVIKSLDKCAGTGNTCDTCLYKEYEDCSDKLKQDAARLLEQDRESEIATVVDKYRLLDGFFKFIRAEVEWFDGDNSYAESCMQHIMGAIALIGGILDSGESLVRKENADANERL